MLQPVKSLIINNKPVRRVNASRALTTARERSQWLPRLYAFRSIRSRTACAKSHGQRSPHSRMSQVANYGSPIESRYIVNPSTGCWEWIAGNDGKHGYGRVRREGFHQAHAYMYAKLKGPIPHGMHVLHRCDNPPCVNPEHLFLGTHHDNMRDKANKGRLKATGSDNPCSKLHEHDVLLIKLALRAGDTCEGLGKKYGVSAENIRHIKKGRKWVHVHLGLDGVE